MKAKILISDPLNRFTKGEIGNVLDNDSNKYDYFIELEPLPIDGKTKTPFLDGITKLKRNLYFYKSEVEIINESSNS